MADEQSTGGSGTPGATGPAAHGPVGPKVKVFDCPNCGAGVMLRAQGRSISVVCGSCGSVIDAANENYRILSRFRLNAKIQPLIPLGKRAKFMGDTWECIGFVVRTTGGEAYAWREYLLFNPYKGYRWLTEYDGHWTWVQMLTDRPARPDGPWIKYLGLRYKLFQSGKAQVSYVMGEFYWRVKVGDEAEYFDYIAPPHVLTAEAESSELNWSHGEYVEPAEVGAAFGLGEALPARFGIGATQPYPYASSRRAVWQLTWIFVLILLALSLLSMHFMGWNFIVGAVLLIMPPLGFEFHATSFETRRWTEESSVNTSSPYLAGLGDAGDAEE